MVNDVFFVRGGRQAIVVEPNTVSEEYSIVWRRPGVDADELIYLRTVKRLTYKELGAHFNRPATNIRWNLTLLKKEGKL